LQIKTKIVSCHITDSKPVKQEVNGRGILPPLVYPAGTFANYKCKMFYNFCLERIFKGKNTNPYTNPGRSRFLLFRARPGLRGEQAEKLEVADPEREDAPAVVPATTGRELQAGQPG